MTEITKVLYEQLPAVKLMGKCYTNDDRDAFGGYGGKWGEWFQNGYFAALEAIGEAKDIENGYLGFMRCNEDGSNFEYWIGMFLPTDAPVPEGFAALDIPSGKLCTFFLYGREDDGLYAMHDACMQRLFGEEKQQLRNDVFPGKRTYCFFERYNCPRFTQEDEQGKKTLDYCAFVE